MDLLFPFTDYWWLYATFTIFILLMLALDLGVFHRTAHEVSFKEATAWSVVWVALALVFNIILYYYSLSKFGADLAKEVSLEFLTGYIVEKSLSVDNIFVFVVVFAYFAIPAKYQHRVLFYGIIGALIFRALFIAAGSWLMQFKIVAYFFGAILIITGVKMLLSLEKEVEPEKNPVIKLFKRFVSVTANLEGQKFFIKKDGKVFATPLFIALLFLEMTDIIFAIDSVPAIFALTREPMIVYTSNIFAILGLRAMYFMLAGAINKFYLLKYGLAVVLIFVGLKMVWLNEAFGGKFPITWSLGFILTTISLSVLASLLFPTKEDTDTEKSVISK
ncbi:MAG: TerC family protein [Acidobacteria bacterium]|nr:MAG: TerC family protein [Acidobacteriota bacterium]